VGLGRGWAAAVAATKDRVRSILISTRVLTHDPVASI